LPQRAHVLRGLARRVADCVELLLGAQRRQADLVEEAVESREAERAVA
jgi:hypothetical protein